MKILGHSGEGNKAVEKPAKAGAKDMFIDPEPFIWTANHHAKLTPLN